MPSRTSSSERIIIVGGGFAGLSAAARLAQAGLPVTVLESSRLGYAASTRNQGWLHSGAWFAPTHRAMARMCYESLQQTIAFCPECLEPAVPAMAYVGQGGEKTQIAWTGAWDEAGIPYEPIPDSQIARSLPHLVRMSWGMRLPDRSFRPDVLLSQLAATARNAGAEIRPNTVVTGLRTDDRRVNGVAVGMNEEIRARMVILATGACSQQGFLKLFQPIAGRQSDYRLVCLKSHLKAIRPGLLADAFCVVDGWGLNHLPHHDTSVFGTSRWTVVPGTESDDVDPNEIAVLDGELARLFPHGFGTDVEVTTWAGTTVQAMHAEQIEPGAAPLPTIVDHSREPSGLDNLLSIFPGRATLWAHLAEQVRTIVLEKIGSRMIETTAPAWEVSP